ncbi:MAG TPA: hypothetical protein VIG55_01205 [Methylosinus sp.]|jgi:hypothetical protein
MRLRSPLSIAVVLALATMPGAASAQDWTLDTSGAATAAAAKGKKARPEATASAKPEKGAGKGENRQFGELEGWSPGKSPPKKKEKEDDTPRYGRAPVNMNSTGGMGVGMPF